MSLGVETSYRHPALQLPQDCIRTLMDYSANHAIFCICKKWRAAMEDYYKRLYTSYREDQKVRSFTLNLPETPAIQDYIRAVHSAYRYAIKLAKPGHISRFIDVRLVEMPMKIPSYVSEIEDAHLVHFFQRLHNKLDLKYIFDLIFFSSNTCVSQKAIEIRHWMEKNKRFCESLTKLELSNCNLSLLPPEIRYFKHLQILDLSVNQFVALPEEIGELNNLKELYLNTNALDSLPQGIKKLGLLQTVNLANNQFTRMPDEVCSLRQLRHLDISLNPIDHTLPPEMSYLQQLIKLSANGLRLKKIPSIIFELKNLEEISFMLNEITGIPSAIGCLHKLKKIVFSSNSLTSIPLELLQLRYLKYIDLRSNQITEIPAWIENLTALEQLDLRSNKVSVLPEKFKKMVNT